MNLCFTKLFYVYHQYYYSTLLSRGGGLVNSLNACEKC